MTGDRARLERWFTAGRLRRPGAGDPSLVDLACAVALRAGAPQIPPSPHTEALAALIPAAEHLVFVLADGLGSALLETLPAGAFLRRHCRARLTTVFPSTTATALTSLFTARWPAEHGIVGWWVRLPDAQLTTTVLPFVERFGRQPLAAHGLGLGDVFPFPSLLPTFARRPLCVLPAAYADSVYAEYISGGTDRAGYDTVAEALALVRSRVASASPPTYSYVYLPQVDALSHALGPEHAEVRELVAQLDAALAGLHGALSGSARLVVAADHGQVTRPAERSLALREGDPLLDRLRCPPAGEPAVPMFHAAPGQARRFAEEHADRFGDAFALLCTDDVEALRLFGPLPLTPLTRARIGDFLALAVEPATLVYLPAGAALPSFTGIHAGLSPAEMQIPLIVA